MIRSTALIFRTLAPTRPIAAIAVATLTIACAPAAFAQAPPASQPAVAPLNPDDALNARANAMRRDATRKRHAALPEIPAVDDLDDLVTLSADADGHLSAQIMALPPDAKPQMRVKVRDLKGVAFDVTAQGSFVAGNGRPAVPLPSVGRYDLDVTSDDAIWSTRLDATDGYLRVVGQSVAARYVLLQNKGLLTFTYRRVDNVQSFRAQGSSIRELQDRFPREFDDLIVPLLSKFSDLPFLRPGPAEVYSVFAEVKPDDAVTFRVIDLLPQLAADDFATRDAASKALASLGAPGVLAVMRLDEESAGPLTVEQRTRLSSLVSAAHRLPQRSFDATSARSEPRFLADCLENPDLAVRTLAKSELERLLGHSIDFDVTLPADARGPAADAVRKVLPKSKGSATRPVVGS